jgi:beta-mannosidase
VTTGEVMARVFGEWRSAQSPCRGGLVWFLRDLWAGAGWGVLDSRGLPKACFYYLSRAWQPQTVVLTEEGMNGLDVHVVNERDTVLEGTLELTLVRDGRAMTAQVTSPVLVQPRTTWRASADALLGRFTDISYTYRFGPPTHDVVAATLYDVQGAVRSEAIWVRDAATSARRMAGAVLADISAGADGSVDVTVTPEGFLFAAHVHIPGLLADAAYFSLLPGRSRVVHLHPLGSVPRAAHGELRALNLDQPIRIAVPAHPGVEVS